MSTSIITLTFKELAELHPCWLESRKVLFKTHKTLNAKQALELGVSIPDLLWVAAKVGRKDLCVRFALACAQRVAHLSTDPRVQKALDATQYWLDNPTSKAAGAADLAADTRAVLGEAGAAHWAAGAARAAAGAAYWATARVTGAAGAAWAAEEVYQRRVFLQIFCEGDLS